MAISTPGSISFSNVSKSFSKQGSAKSSYSTLKTHLLNSIGLGPRAKANKSKTYPTQQTFSNKRSKALDGISFEIKAGSSVALIGRNGSGKSTILKLLAGIYTPDTGSVNVTGSISALIELGAGFHPDFSGRENIYLGGIMFGLSKTQIAQKFDEIVQYAELEDVIDEPVRTYSSGMYMRLGFSLAIHTDPDILLVDEVLAVGDAHFIHKCQDSISEFKRKGKTLVFVTHDLSSVSKWCDEAIWLDQGSIRMRGTPRRIADSYLLSVRSQEEVELGQQDDSSTDLLISSQSPSIDPGKPSDLDTKRWGNQHVSLSEVQMLKDGTEKAWTFTDEDCVTIKSRFTINKATEDLVFGIGIIRVDGLEVFGTNTGFRQDDEKLVQNKVVKASLNDGYFECKIKRLRLTEGTYFLDVACHAEDGTPYDYHHRMHKFQVRTNKATHGVFEAEFDWDFHRSDFCETRSAS